MYRYNKLIFDAIFQGRLWTEAEKDTYELFQVMQELAQLSCETRSEEIRKTMDELLKLKAFEFNKSCIAALIRNLAPKEKREMLFPS
jgi:hypothetical protein